MKMGVKEDRGQFINKSFGKISRRGVGGVTWKNITEAEFWEDGGGWRSLFA
jgi:hypothetical protein